MEAMQSHTGEDYGGDSVIVSVKMPSNIVRQLTQMAAHTNVTLAEAMETAIQKAVKEHDFSGYIMDAGTAETVFGINYGVLRQAIKDGIIPSSKKGNKQYIDAGDLKRWQEAN